MKKELITLSELLWANELGLRQDSVLKGAGECQDNLRTNLKLVVGEQAGWRSTAKTVEHKADGTCTKIDWDGLEVIAYEDYAIRKKTPHKENKRHLVRLDSVECSPIRRQTLDIPNTLVRLAWDQVRLLRWVLASILLGLILMTTWLLSDQVFRGLPVIAFDRQPSAIKIAADGAILSDESNLTNAYFAKTPHCLAFGALPGSAIEAQETGRLLGNRRILIGKAAATESAVERTTGPRILHLATHGFFLGGDELEELPVLSLDTTVACGGSVVMAQDSSGDEATSTASSAAGSGSGLKKLALIVNGDCYKVWDNRAAQGGAALNDVANLKAVLGKFGFAKNDIPALSNGEVTRERILSAIQEHLIGKAKNSEVVVFYYSGHGSQVRDESDGDGIDGLSGYGTARGERANFLIARNGSVDAFCSDGNAGDTVQIAVVGAGDLDEQMELFDPKGNRIETTSRDGGIGSAALPMTGAYTVLVSDLNQNETKPPCSVNETHGFQIRSDESLGAIFDQRVAKSAMGVPLSDPITIDTSKPFYSGSGYYATDANNFSPRISAAWTPTFENSFLRTIFGGEGESAFRGGFAISYDRIGSQLAVCLDLCNTLGFSSSQMIAAETYNVTDNLASLFTSFDMDIRSLPGFNVPSKPTFPLQSPSDGARRIESSLDDTLTTPINYSWNFSIGRKLPDGLFLESSYIGRRARNLLATRDIMHLNNLRDPTSGQTWYEAAIIMDARLNDTPIETFPGIPFFEDLFGSLPTSGLFFIDPNLTATQNVLNLVSRQGFDILDWTFIQDLIDDGGFFPSMFFHPQVPAFSSFSTISKTDYHAFTLTLRERFKDSLNFDFNYTLSKSISDFNTNWRSNIPVVLGREVARPAVSHSTGDKIKGAIGPPGEPSLPGLRSGDQLLYLLSAGVDAASRFGEHPDFENRSVFELSNGIVAGPLYDNQVNVTNTNEARVTIRFQYFNQDCLEVLDFLVAVAANETISFNPFDYVVPGGLDVSERLFGGSRKQLVRPISASVFGDGRFYLLVTASTEEAEVRAASP